MIIFITVLLDIMDDYWNIFDTFLFLIFYAALGTRLAPIYGKIIYLGKENCYEVARQV